MPKTILGRPVDVQFRKMQFLPRFAQKITLRLAMRLVVGQYESYGLPEPNTDVLASHPTLSTDILEVLTHGKVSVCSETQAVSGTIVEFSNGDTSDFDTIVWATGYKTQFPLLKDPLFDWSENLRLPLYLKIMPANIDDIFFVGLIQPLGCLWTLADYQSDLVAHAITKKSQRLSDIERRLAKEHALDAARYSNTTRHAVEVDFHEYRKTMQRQLDF